MDFPEFLGIFQNFQNFQYIFCEIKKITGVCEQKRPLRKIDAKASFEAWSTPSDAIFREESEFEVENGPKLIKKQVFKKFEKFEKLEKLKNWKLPQISKFPKFIGGDVFFAKIEKLEKMKKT